MRFFRRQSEFAVLALVALAAQTLLSFGHTHARHAIDPASARSCQTLLPPSADRPCPPPHDDEQACSICWSISVASAAVLGFALSLALRLDLASTLPDLRDPLDVPDSITASFQPRGPPASMLP